MGQDLTKIICIGNRFVAEDSLGMQVYDLLSTRSLPEGVVLVEGGLAGIDLLPQLEGASHVIFVDALAGTGEGAPVQQLKLSDVPVDRLQHCDHGTSFLYLLGMLPELMDSKLPEITLLGAAGIPDARVVEDAASRALALAGGGA